MGGLELRGVAIERENCGCAKQKVKQDDHDGKFVPTE